MNISFIKREMNDAHWRETSLCNESILDSFLLNVNVFNVDYTL